MTRVLAREMARDRIRVNAVAAGMVETSMVGGLRSVVTDEQYQAIVGKYPWASASPGMLPSPSRSCWPRPGAGSPAPASLSTWL